MKSMFRLFSTVLFIVLALSLASCSSAKKKAEGEVAGAPADAGTQFELYGDSDSMKAGDLRTIYFEFDSSEITEASKDTLAKNAEFLKQKADVTIQVEGHCDERGSDQYNLALGEKRAKSVKDHLVSLGVDVARVTTISYGKERPLAFGHEEESWSKNRRGNFVITKK